MEENYRESYQERYTLRSDQRRANRDLRRSQQTHTFEGILHNPRLIAALQAEDPSQFYYDLSQLAGPSLRQLEIIEPGPPPFLTFLHWDESNRFPIPKDIYRSFGLRHPFDSEKLRELTKPLSQRETADLPSAVGIVEIEGPVEPLLYEAYVIPLIDYFGEFWGDVVFFIPLEASYGINFRENQRSLLQGYVTRSQVYLDAPLGLSPEQLIAAAGSSSGQNPDLTIYQIGKESWAGILTPLEQASGFTEVWEFSLYSMRSQHALIQSIRETLLGITGAFAILAMLLGLSTIRQFTRPLADLVEGTEAVREGQLNHRIPVRTRDELGHLADRFNSMVGDLELKERYRAVLDKVTDSRVADELTSGKIALGGERRDATVLFCDLRSFTNWSTGLSPEDLVANLNQHMTAMTECVSQYGGVVDKFIGDEVMVLFGLPTQSGNPAEQAVLCAEAMLRRREALNETKNDPIDIGIGIATGELIAGCMGSEDRLNYTAVGCVVNLASRLCSIAPPQQCYLDEVTTSLVTDKSIALVGEMMLKGFNEPVVIHQLGKETS